MCPLIGDETGSLGVPCNTVTNLATPQGHKIILFLKKSSLEDMFIDFRESERNIHVRDIHLSLIHI